MLSKEKEPPLSNVFNLFAAELMSLIKAIGVNGYFTNLMFIFLSCLFKQMCIRADYLLCSLLKNSKTPRCVYIDKYIQNNGQKITLSMFSCFLQKMTGKGEREKGFFHFFFRQRGKNHCNYDIFSCLSHWRTQTVLLSLSSSVKICYCHWKKRRFYSFFRLSSVEPRKSADLHIFNDECRISKEWLIDEVQENCQRRRRRRIERIVEKNHKVFHWYGCWNICVTRSVEFSFSGTK